MYYTPAEWDGIDIYVNYFSKYQFIFITFYEYKCEFIDISQILSECSFLLKNMPDDKLMSLLQRQFLRRSLDTPTRLWILSCTTSLLCGGVVKPGTLKEALKAMRDALTASPTKAPDFTLQQVLSQCLDLFCWHQNINAVCMMVNCIWVI